MCPGIHRQEEDILRTHGGTRLGGKWVEETHTHTQGATQPHCLLVEGLEVLSERNSLRAVSNSIFCLLLKLQLDTCLHELVRKMRTSQSLEPNHKLLLEPLFFVALMGLSHGARKEGISMSLLT